MATIQSAQAFLDEAYSKLDLFGGELLDPTDTPSDELTTQQWIDKGDWLSLARKVRAQKIFFVDNNPVIVFAKINGSDVDALRTKFNEVWCMARPILLFLANENSLTVYNLTKPPSRTRDEWIRTSPELSTVRTIKEVARELHKYRREQIESGRLFEDKHFGSPTHRADQTLIENLRLLRASLHADGLKGTKLKYAHALIGRSIFIRYLEDRGILTREYFESVAKKSDKWQRLLQTHQPLLDINSRMDNVLYFRVLNDKEFTYALFAQLAHDFNGDMFPTDNAEKHTIEPNHLDLLRQFLRGEAGPQRNLFFWAYRFDIIPIELISSIYEEFYHIETRASDGTGTHYTPASLVEFLVSQTLTADRLATNPRVIDTAAGSGIFLVESFRRMIRYERLRRNGRKLTFRSLQKILRNQIAGIEINQEAVRVAAFSLYLALLHYQKPPDILRHIAKGNRLPHLIYRNGTRETDKHLNCLISGDAFDIASIVADPKVRRRFTSNCADVVVGNPPWGAANEKLGVETANVALEWCRERNLPVSDKERSQAFIWRTLDLLKNGGVAGLLVSTGILYKKLRGSHDFRDTWLRAVRLQRVVNFAHVRDVFFKGPSREVDAISPFASIEFQKASAQEPNHLVHYWSAKRTAQVEQLQAVVLSEPDFHLIPQEDLRADSDLWKVYWWGSHRDAALIGSLKLNPKLRDFCDPKSSGQGFSSAIKETKPTPTWLLEYKYLPANRFQRYGPLHDDDFTSVPPRVKRVGKREAYEGIRLLIKHGISQTSDDKGQIVARVETASFCFSNSINGLKLLHRVEYWEYLVILGIVWSSLARYYFFLTASKWGMWHFGIHKDELLDLPIMIPDSEKLRNRICQIVERLRAWNPARRSVLNPYGKPSHQITADRQSLESDLNDAIFDLYKLTEAERDLVRDMCEIGIEFLYRSSSSRAAQPITVSQKQVFGVYSDLPEDRASQGSLQAYLHSFLKIWNGQLLPEGQLQWHVIQPAGDFPLIAITFLFEPSPQQSQVFASEYDEWIRVIHSLETDLLYPVDGKQIYIDGMVRAVTSNSIIIIKRNELRLWTRSMAREDAEATLVQAMNLQEAGGIIRDHVSSSHDGLPLVG
jgi:type I restriction-modification system DNA methylase subunit